MASECVTEMDEVEKIRTRLVAEALRYEDDDGNEQSRDAEGQYANLLESLTTTAVESTRSKHGDDCITYVHQSIHILFDLYQAISSNLENYDFDKPDPHDRRSELWKHEIYSLELVAANKAPTFYRHDIENAVSRYLDLPFRDKQVDRVLVDILAAMELFAFIEQFFEKSWLGTPKLISFHVFWVYLINQILTGLVVSGIAYVAYLAGWETASAVLIGLYLLYFAYCVFALPFAWRRQTKHKRRIVELLEAMNGVYAELGSSGDISARHIRERVTQTANKGVVWPGPLAAMLDDIVARTGRF